jgi:hypothetical protein
MPMEDGTGYTFEAQTRLSGLFVGLAAERPAHITASDEWLGAHC